MAKTHHFTDCSAQVQALVNSLNVPVFKQAALQWAQCGGRIRAAACIAVWTLLQDLDMAVPSTDSPDAAAPAHNA